MHAYTTLPSSLFIDQYQLADPLLLASKNLRRLNAVYGVTDLEAPIWAVERWGSSALLELAAPPVADAASESWRVDIPVHLRYLSPTPGGSATVQVPWPIVFWACRLETAVKGTNPFTRANLGYDPYFDAHTIFHHAAPGFSSGLNLMEEIQVPVLDDMKTAWLASVTGVVVSLGLIWVSWKMTLLYFTNSKEKFATHDTRKRQ